MEGSPGTKIGTILQAAKAAELIFHPLLPRELDVRSHVPGLRSGGSEARTLQAACSQPATDGMVVLTNSPAVRKPGG